MTRPTDKGFQKSKVNTPPRGLQFLLGNVNQGINPHELNHEIQPTTDLFPYWAVDRTEYTEFSGSVAAVFQQQTIRVPDGEIWIPYSMAGFVTTTTIGESLVIGIGVANEANTRRIQLAVSDNSRDAATAQETSVASFTWPTIQPIRSDEYFFIQCNKFKADSGSRSVQLYLRFIRLKV